MNYVKVELQTYLTLHDRVRNIEAEKERLRKKDNSIIEVIKTIEEGMNLYSFRVNESGYYMIITKDEAVSALINKLERVEKELAKKYTSEPKKRWFKFWK